MKTSTLLIGIVVGFLTLSVNAQDTIWFDSNWNTTTKENATYYRPTPKSVDNGFWIVDYFMNGTKQMEGFSTIAIPDKEKFNGLILYYHENGKIFHKANYKDGKLHGIRKIFYKSGTLKNERIYKNGKSEGDFVEYYGSGVIKEAGKYTNGKQTGKWKTFFENKKIETVGMYKNGKKAGIWKTYYKNAPQ